MEDAIHRIEKEFFDPNLYLFDAYPGGIGFSEPLYRAHELLMVQTRELIVGCGCESGCPSCVGPAGEFAPRAEKAGAGETQPDFGVRAGPRSPAQAKISRRSGAR